MYGMVSSQSHARSTSRRKIQQQPALVSNELLDNPEVPKTLYERLMSCMRQTWTGVKSSLDSDFDDMDNPVYRRPKGLDHLVSVTHFSRPELKRLYRAFKAEAPTGLITEETFRTMYSQFFPKGAANGSQYSRYVFNSLVQDQSGPLGFEDIVLVLSDLCRGSADKKLRWAFHIYDIDGDGVISRSELEDVALSINELTGETSTTQQPTDPIVHSSAVRLWVDRIFQKMDLNDDGVISQEEFLSVCLQDEDISRSLSIFNDVF